MNKAINVAESFAKKILLTSRTEEAYSYLHSGVNKKSDNIETALNSYHRFGNPDELRVYGYVISREVNGAVNILLEGKNYREQFYYICIISREEDNSYKLLNIFRSAIKVITENYKPYSGKIFSSSVYNKSQATLDRENLLHRFDEAPISIDLKNGKKINITAIAQEVYSDQKNFHLVIDFISNLDNASSQDQLLAEISALWKDYLLDTISKSNVKHVRIKMYFDEYIYGKKGYKHFVQGYDFNEAKSVWEPKI